MSDHPIEIEEWRPVSGYEGVYSVSNLGRVKRDSRGERGILVPRRSSTGYITTTLYVDCIGKTKLTHCLVLEAFVGPCPNGMCARHNDDDRANAKLSNLRWDTRPHVKRWSKEIHEKIRAMKLAGKKRKEIAATTGVSPAHISRLVGDRRKKPI